MARPLAGLALVATLFATATFAGSDDEAGRTKAITIGDTLPSFEAKDADGGTFSLAAARTISEADAAAAVATAAKAFGAADAKPETAIDALPGVARDGKPDPDRRASFVQAAWKSFGLVATPATTKDLATLGDVARKIVASAEAPIVLFAWSSNCPTCALYYDRLLEVFSTSGARVFPFAANHDDPLDAIRGAIEARELPYRILLDPEAKLADVLGARTTPHTFVLDAKNVLRYSGSPDNDPTLDGDEAKRLPYLADALAAVSAGRQVEIRVTLPKG